MALPTPGNVTPMTPQIEQPANTLPGIDQAQANANPPPLPGAGAPPAASGLEAPPLPGMGGAPVQQAFHQPGTPPPVQGAEEIAPVTVIDHGQQAEYPTGAEMAQAQVVDATPAPPVDQAPPPLPQQTQTPPQQQMQPPPVQQPPQQQMQPPPQQQTPPQQQMQPPPVQQAPPPQQQMQPPPQQMQAPVQQIMPAQQPLQAPAVPPVGGNIIAAAGGISQALAAQGFEGLDMGFGSFPIVKLQDTTFSTSDGDTLGNTFCCVMHASRKKFLLKCEDSNDAEEFVYSYDKVHTTGNKLVEDVKKAWGTGHCTFC